VKPEPSQAKPKPGLSGQARAGKSLKAINRRLTDDKITATVIKRERPFTQLVEATWEYALQKISDLPIEWIHDREVLVGRSTHRA
jgi:hypothetical protein